MLLALHNLLRWIVLAAAAMALVRAMRGINGRVDYTTGARRAVSMFVIAFHLQILLGLVVYGTSRITLDAMGNMGAAMKDPGVRVFVAEHPALMILAAIVATMTSVIARRGPDDEVRHKRAAIGVALALGLMLAGIPWARPMMPVF